MNVGGREPGLKFLSGNIYQPTSVLYVGRALADDPSYLDLLQTGRADGGVYTVGVSGVWTFRFGGLIGPSQPLVPPDGQFTVVVRGRCVCACLGANMCVCV